jgi:hypothetical protein
LKLRIELADPSGEHLDVGILRLSAE